jgi:hypothetical protein
MARGLALYYSLLNETALAGGLPNFHDADCAAQAARAHQLKASVLQGKIHTEWKLRGGMFGKDMRGSHIRDFIMNEEDLLQKFTDFMLRTRYLTVDIVTEFVNSDQFLGATDDVEGEKGAAGPKHLSERDALAKYNISFPIGRNAVWRWMHKCGAEHSTDGDKKCYYTDRHNDEDVVKDRNMRYTPEMEKYEVRDC